MQIVHIGSREQFTYSHSNHIKLTKSGQQTARVSLIFTCDVQNTPHFFSIRLSLYDFPYLKWARIPNVIQIHSFVVMVLHAYRQTDAAGDSFQTRPKITSLRHWNRKFCFNGWSVMTRDLVRETSYILKRRAC